MEEKDYNNALFQADAKDREPSADSPGCIRKFYSSLSSLASCPDDNSCPDTTGLIDLIVCIGGDGTILYASTLFQQSCPPVLASFFLF